MEIPKIIHQIWSGINEPLPSFFKDLGESWKRLHPHWKYEFWDNEKINNFILDFYPQYWETYNKFPYNIQRWDAIRYLILNKIGGLYVDFDTECLEAFDKLLEKKSCCFSCEYPELYKKDYFFNNALMASIPNHPFMELIVKNVFLYKKENFKDMDKGMEVINSTGPRALMKWYEEYPDKDSIYLIPPQYVTPLFKNEIIFYLKGYIEEEELNKKIQEAYSIHYFFNTWLNGIEEHI